MVAPDGMSLYRYQKFLGLWWRTTLLHLESVWRKETDCCTYHDWVGLRRIQRHAPPRLLISNGSYDAAGTQILVSHCQAAIRNLRPRMQIDFRLAMVIESYQQLILQLQPRLVQPPAPSNVCTLPGFVAPYGKSVVFYQRFLCVCGARL